MQNFIINNKRCELLGEFIVEQNATVREAARKFGVSKSTVHKDVTQDLQEANKPLFEEVRRILEKNKSERHLRGGEATKKKYLQKKECSELLN